MATQVEAVSRQAQELAATAAQLRALAERFRLAEHDAALTIDLARAA
jgi:uncharacterized coiled-coil protein SlyX